MVNNNNLMDARSWSWIIHYQLSHLSSIMLTSLGPILHFGLTQKNDIVNPRKERNMMADSCLIIIWKKTFQGWLVFWVGANPTAILTNESVFSGKGKPLKHLLAFQSFNLRRVIYVCVYKCLRADWSVTLLSWDPL